jgi:hypothetical protein
LRFHRHRHPVVSTRCFTGIVRVGVKIPQDGNRGNTYEHVAVVHEHVWRTLCSVYGEARVLPSDGNTYSKTAERVKNSIKEM